MRIYSLPINQDRRKAIWDSLDQEISTNPQPLLDALPFEEVTPEGIVPMSKHEEVRADYQLQGLSLKGHPLTFIRPWLSEQNCNKINELSQTSLDFTLVSLDWYWFVNDQAPQRESPLSRLKTKPDKQI